MAGIVEAAQQLAQQLVDAGVPATHDPAAAAARRPCVLVAPPAIDYTQQLNTWHLVCLAGVDAGQLQALDQLDELVQGVLATQLPIEAADPRSYPLTPSTGTVPAYVLRMTT